MAEVVELGREGQGIIRGYDNCESPEVVELGREGQGIIRGYDNCESPCVLV